MSYGNQFNLTQQMTCRNGASLAAANLYFYETGTTTDQAVYTTSDLSVAHSQPVPSDANGVFPAIYMNPDASVDYRVRLEDTDANLIWQEDNIPRINENFETGSFTVTYTGFSADPASTSCTWYRSGRQVFLDLPVGTGTSNSIAFSLTGLPTDLRPETSQYQHFPFCQDNSAHVTGGCLGQINTLGVINFALADATYNVNGWTNSGAKGILISGQFAYRLTDS